MKSIPLRQWEAAAYAAGRLTQLRRVVKPQPVDAPEFVGGAKVQVSKSKLKSIEVSRYIAVAAPRVTYCSPYGAPGDRLALRETWAEVDWSLWNGDLSSKILYKADYPNGRPPSTIWGNTDKWRSPVTMPLWAVRWHPVITAVRLERVQDMSEADARACGFDGNCPVGYIPSHQEGPCVYHYATQFDRDSPRTPWEDNPYTWVIDVEGVKP